MNYNQLLTDIVTLQARQELEQLTGCHFSPGEWLTDHSGQRMIIHTPEGDIIAIIAQSQVGPVKAQANAQLIITAPRLYQALEALVVSAYDPEEGDCLICGAPCAWGGGPHDRDCEVEVATRILALARGEKQG